MNTKAKIAAGVVAGLVAGTALMSAAFGAPTAPNDSPFGRYGMMGSIAGSADRPTVAQMRSFMNGYRTSSGAIDMNRMHADVTSGKVTPPCFGGAARAGQGSPTQSGYGMMGSRY